MSASRTYPVWLGGLTALAVSGLCAIATPATAQSLPASLRPCVATHFDPVLYQQALESWGWVLIPGLSRAAQAQDLAAAFAGVSVETDGTSAQQLEAAQLFWKDQVEEALVFDGQGQTLLLAAGLDGDGNNTVRCFATLPTGALGRAFEAAETRAPGSVRGDAWQHFTTRYDAYAPGQTLAVTFVRTGPGAGTPGSDGFATALTVSLEPEVCPSGTLDMALSTLRADGWTPADSSVADIGAYLAWTLMVPYLEGDSGGEDIASLLSLQERAVPGLFRKADTDATRTRILTRPDGAMTLTETTDPLGQTTRTCRIARDAAPPSGTASLAAPGAPETLIEIVTVLPLEATQ